MVECLSVENIIIPYHRHNILTLLYCHSSIHRTYSLRHSTHFQISCLIQSVCIYSNPMSSTAPSSWKESLDCRGDKAIAADSKLEQLVDYIILAEFDIDTGSTVRHQYPHPVVGYNNDWFAEYMLPEGAHNRDKDWTYIFLNREQRQLDEVPPPLSGSEWKAHLTNTIQAENLDKSTIRKPFAWPRLFHVWRQPCADKDGQHSEKG